MPRPPLARCSLLPRPETAEVVALIPDGPPRQFRWRGVMHQVADAEGPERIAPEWWRRTGAAERDYYVVEDTAGAASGSTATASTAAERRPRDGSCMGCSHEPPSPSWSLPPTSRSCAGPRMRTRWSARRRSWGWPPSALPTAIRWPASCARIPAAKEAQASALARRRAPRHHATASRRSAIPTDRAAYGRLCRLLTRGNRRAIKGQCHFSFEEMRRRRARARSSSPIPPRPTRAGLRRAPGARSLAAARGRVYLAATFAYRGDERRRLGELAELAAQARAPLVATNDALYHHPDAQAARRRAHLHPREMHDRRGRLPPGGQCRAASEARRRDGAAVRAASRRPSRARVEIAERIHFNLDELRYEYPDEPVPPGKTPQAIWRS